MLQYKDYAIEGNEHFKILYQHDMGRKKNNNGRGSARGQTPTSNFY